MRAFEIRNLSDDEIQTKLEESHEALFNLRFQLVIGQAKDPNQISVVKKDIARLKTVLRERALDASAH
jgi:large subunit ribosomal protein L29